MLLPLSAPGQFWAVFRSLWGQSHWLDRACSPIALPRTAPVQLQPHVPLGGEELDSIFPMYKATCVPPSQSSCACLHDSLRNQPWC